MAYVDQLFYLTSVDPYQVHTIKKLSHLDVVPVEHELRDFDERLPDILGQFSVLELSEQRLQVLLGLFVGGQRHFVFDCLALGTWQVVDAVSPLEQKTLCETNRHANMLRQIASRFQKVRQVYEIEQSS